MKPFYEIRAEADTDHAEILIYSPIGKSYWEETVEAKKFVEELNDLDVSTISLRINSPGGSVFDGTAIFNAIVRHKATVTTYIDGLAASIASVIALAGDKVVMADNAMFMIHNPWSIAIGNSDDMRKMAEILDKIRDVMVRVYDKKASLGSDEIRDAMAEETWYDADEALEAGFVDEIGEGKDIANISHFTAEALAGYKHAPDRVAAELRKSPTAALADFDVVFNLDAPADQVLAKGRTLSAANETKLRDARDAIDDVLDQVSGDDDGNARGATAPASRDTRSTLEVERTAALLARTRV